MECTEALRGLPTPKRESRPRLSGTRNPIKGSRKNKFFLNTYFCIFIIYYSITSVK